MGQKQPTRLDFCRDRDQRSPAALERHFPNWIVVRLTTSLDLEHSFGPAYLRGLVRQGQRGMAALSVNEQETQATVDGALTTGILWLDACRLAQEARRVIEGLVMVVPKGTAALTEQLMLDRHRTAAKWQLYEFDERADEMAEVDIGDHRNLPRGWCMQSMRR